MSTEKKFIPASFFGIVMGLVGLGDCWRAASKLWGFPEAIGEAVMYLAFIVWFVLLIAYIAKWILAPEQAKAEWHHLILGKFIGLIAVATLLVVVAIEPHFPALINPLFILGTIFQLAYGIHFTTTAWKGGRDPFTISPAIYLPTVAANFVNAFVAGYINHPTMAIFFIGFGLFSWLSLESVIANRLIIQNALPEPMRPLMGILMAPPSVCCLAYVFINGKAGPAPDLAAQILLAYSCLIFLNLLRMMPWVAKQPFNASYWAFSFGLAAITFDLLFFRIRGAHPIYEWLGKGMFIITNIVLAILIVKTIQLFLTKRLLPPPLPL